MGEKLTDSEKQSFINDIIKSIVKSSFGKNVIYDGSVAVYKMILNSTKSELISKRELSILDINLDLYNYIHKMTEENLTKSQLRKRFFNYLNENFVPILVNSKYFSDVELLEVNIKPKRIKKSHYGAYILEFKIHLQKEFENDYKKLKEFKNYSLNIDIVVIKDMLPFNQMKILLDNEILDVNVYEPEKYFAGKILSGLTHIKHYEELISKGVNNYRILENLIKINKVVNDIHLFKNYLKISIDKLQYYFKILSEDNRLDVLDAIKLLEKYYKE